jgi:hypothetical protein
VNAFEHDCTIWPERDPERSFLMYAPGWIDLLTRWWLERKPSPR